VRDPQRRPGQAALLNTLLAARPDAIVVDMGWPGVDQPPESAARIVTFGASRTSGEAAAAILVGAGAAIPRRTTRG
jgi:beta-N-acetylhexosaminidase